ncbi:MAG: ABC transporter permease [Eubacteriales bacterium]
MSIKRFWRIHSSKVITYLIALLLLVVVGILKPGYASVNNLNYLSVTAAILGITALGQTFVVLTGGMDLSIPWMFTMTSFVMAEVSGGQNEGLVYAVPVALLLGLAMGLLNGFGVSYIGILPVIMTISTNIIFQGLLLGFSNGTPGGTPPPLLKTIATGTTGGFSTLFLIWIVLVCIALLVFYKTRFGRSVYAIGSNEKVALYSGINVKRVKLLVYGISGLMAAFAGVLYSGRLGQLYLGMGDPYQMQTVTAVAIGGVSLVGGKGSYVGTIAGALILVVLDGFLSAMSITPSIKSIIYGVVLLLAVLVSGREVKDKKKANA